MVKATTQAMSHTLIPPDVTDAPAPWTLNGHGYIFLLKSSRDSKQTSGIGALMLASYESSPVGPYHELLLVPGTVHFDDIQRSAFSISKIWVSTNASVYNGRRNWSIPKQLADFDWNVDTTTGRETIRVSLPGYSSTPFFNVTISPRVSWLSIPISSKWVYIPTFLRTLIQPAITVNPKTNKAIPGKYVQVVPEINWANTSLCHLNSVVVSGDSALNSDSKNLKNEEAVLESFITQEEVDRVMSYGIKIQGELVFPEADVVSSM